MRLFGSQHPRALTALLRTGLVLALLLFAYPSGVALGDEAAASTGTTEGTSPSAGVTTVPAPPISGREAPPTETASQATTPPAEGQEATTAPEVQAQSPQASTQGVPGTSRSEAGRSGGSRGSERAAAHHHRSHASAPGTPANDKAKAKSLAPAPLPSALTPPFPSSLGSAVGGIPEFFIENFRVPPFLLPIYQAAGAAYGIPWQVLAAINEVETDYGRDLSVSSAGAEGWMQFLPSSWTRYGVDANGNGYEDPYNPADAIFAAARYLAAAGGRANIRAAIYSYNHSQAYVDSVMLRAQLLGGTPPELLSAITGLTESRFPVHAAAHFADGFQTVPASGSGAATTLAGTTIYAAAGAPVIAVQDGRIVALGESPTLGRYISLRDAYGNTYTYAQLGSVASLYPVIEEREHTAPAARIGKPETAAGPRPSAPASAGIQPHSPLSQAAVATGLAMGAAAALESTPPPASRPAVPPILPPASKATPHTFRAGPDEVYLHTLHTGVEVLAGTVLGHLGSEGQSGAPGAVPVPSPSEAHMLFQIRPAGSGAPLIDPKPILDGWVQLENTSIFRAKGENPFLATSPTVGQVLLESKRQLQRAVLRDPGVRFATRCGRGQVQAGQVDRRALAALEFLSLSGLKPTVSSNGCGGQGARGAANAAGGAAGEAFDITAIDGTPVTGHEQPGSLADIAVHRLLRLQGTMRPRQIATASLSYPGTANTVTLPADRGRIHVSFRPLAGARAARALASTPLTPDQWLTLISRLGEIPDPVVAGKPSSAAIPDGAPVGSRGESNATASGTGEGG